MASARKRWRIAVMVKAIRVLSGTLRAPGTAIAGWRDHRTRAGGHVFPVGRMKFAAKPFRPFVCAHWSARRKRDGIVDHYATAARIGGALISRGAAPRPIADFQIAGHAYRVTLDEPEPMMVDGLCILSLMEADDRLFSVSFLLSSAGDGATLYVGGIQGGIGSSSQVLARYRRMTVDAHGLRPRDLMIELLRIFCRSIGVRRIWGIAEGATYQSDRYFGRRPMQVARMNYDVIWLDRGARQCADCWFDLPLRGNRRTHEQIARHKQRSAYRRRYAMLDRIEERVAPMIGAAINQPL